MRLNYKMLFAALIFGVFFSNIHAQSELIVPWTTDGGATVAVNSLYDTIIGDTLADGTRVEDRVYVLEAGGFYWNTERIDNNGWHLRIVGQDADPTDEFMNPPVIQMQAREDGSTPGGIIRGQGDLTVKNVWMTGALTGSGDQTTYQPFQIDAANGTFVFDNVIFDRSNFAMIAFTNPGNDITVTNCTFRNLIGRPSSQQWEGRGISIWADQKSVVIENNTFFNVGMTAIQIESGAAEYVRVVHNTFVNVGRIITQIGWWREAYVANNVIVNGYWHAEGFIDYSNPGRDPRSWNSGMFFISPLPSSYGPEEGRRILFSNMSAYLAPEFTTYYADSLRIPSMIDKVSKLDFIDIYENMVVADTMWMDPGMSTMTPELYPSMIQNIEDLRAGVSPAAEYFWNLPVFEGEECYECVTWPLPEDFSYTNATLQTASVNGLPLGDLNWFPESKADWEANHDAYVDAIENLAGPVVVYELQNEVQAEDGTLADGAAVLDAEGFSYYDMNSGFIEWTFDVPTAGQYDINLHLNLKSRGTSGVYIIVNEFNADGSLAGSPGPGIHDPRGWGQYVFGNDYANNTTSNQDVVIDDWYWWIVKQEELKEVIDIDPTLTPLYFEAGTNTIRIEASWTDNLYAGFQLLTPGTDEVVLELKGADVTRYSVANPVLEGAPWAPVWFKSVALNGGSATVSFDVAADGDYVVQAFYQNYTGASTGDVLVDGAVVATFDYDVAEDSTGLSGLSPAFALTAGTHTVGMSGNNVNLDLIQLIQKTVVSVDRQKIPEGYSLSQNYPNPFNPATKINFSIGKASDVKLTIYNILGQKVATLLNQELKAGAHTVDFNARRLSSGVYFYGIEAGDVKIHKKMMLLK